MAQTVIYRPSSRPIIQIGYFLDFLNFVKKIHFPKNILTFSKKIYFI